ncbi:MAG TPA: S8 family peptidase, partial [Steroidobacteraceae bacterium]
MSCRHLIAANLAALLFVAVATAGTAPLMPVRFIVQAPTALAAHQTVERVGASVERDLPIINGVSAFLDPWEVTRLRATAGVRIYEDRALATEGLLNVLSPVTAPVVQVVSSTTTPKDGTGVLLPTLLYQTNYPTLVGADALQKAGITGKGVTIAVLDTGLWQDLSQNFGSRLLASIDVLNGGSGPVTGDPYGHGTHVTSIAAGGAMNAAGEYLGIAPQAKLVIVRAFDGTGGGRYTDVIAGLNWIVAHQKQYNIRVLNLSFGAPPQSNYWDDPLNQAVMAAWSAGIVVVASAGNEGPKPMTIGVPGNVPYVITAGALTDNSTPYDGTDDRLASFSSTGPTFEGFVKPELVAPGGHMVASMSRNSYLANIDPGSMFLTDQMFTMSGTSQAAAVTSGVAALMLQSDPTLTPDAVKCRLLAGSRPAINATGKLAYSIFQQGAGLINAVAAVNST